MFPLIDTFFNAKFDGNTYAKQGSVKDEDLG